jgi:hypothetical protein
VRLSLAALSLMLLASGATGCGGKVETDSSSTASGPASNPPADDSTSGASSTSTASPTSTSTASATSTGTGIGDAAITPATSACALPAATEQGLLDRWNAAVAAAAEAIDFRWVMCGLFPHPTIKGGTEDAYVDFAAILLQFFQQGDDFAFLAQNQLFTTPLPIGGINTSFKQLASDVASGVSLFEYAPTATRAAVAVYLARMN